jgi:hypothetical protein
MSKDREAKYRLYEYYQMRRIILLFPEISATFYCTYPPYKKTFLGPVLESEAIKLADTFGNIL